MGYSLLPGHKKTANSGWNEIDLNTDLLDDLDVGKLSMGNFGKSFDEKTDKHAAHYSIPNPWASAYLFHSVLRLNQHQLTAEIIELLLAMLHDYYNYNKLVLRKIDKPRKDSPFYNIWELAPDFIKYDGKIYVFMDPDEKCVYGGLSKTTLVWASQNYKHNYQYSELSSDLQLGQFLKYIKDSNSPESISGLEFNTFWANKPFIEMIEQSDVRTFEHEVRDEAPVTWLVGRKKITDPSGYAGNKYLFGNAMVFDQGIKDDNSILNNPNPDNFINLLLEKRSGTELPLNQGNIQWTLFEELFEDKWVKLSALEGVDLPENVFYYDSFTYPIKPEFLAYQFDPSNLINRGVNLLDDGDVAASNITHSSSISKHKLKHRLNSEVESDSRSIAVWPRFKSNIIPTHIVEYDFDGFKDVPELGFFNSAGKKVAASLLLEKERTRLYRLNEIESFPDYVQITTKVNSRGLLSIKPQNLRKKEEEVTVSIDFGSTHTAVGYAFDKQPPQLMNFAESSPLVFANSESWGGLLEYFIPDGLLPEPPKSFSVYAGLNKVWSPFRTIWRQYLDGSDEFLSKGNIPICMTPEIANQDYVDVKEGLKWSSRAEYRDGFLEQIITMVLVECEAMGAKKVEIRWSYPRSFSHKEKNSMHQFFTKMNERFSSTSGDVVIQINVRGFSEAIAAMDYFIHHEAEFTTQNLVASVDIGGGTSDITFLKDKKILWEDSVKYGGDDINHLLYHIDDVINSNRKRHELEGFKSPFDYSKFVSTWPGISSDWDGQMTDFIHQAGDGTKLFFHKLAIFYAASFYYLGMHLKRKQMESPLSMISVAGNGTQFLKVVSNGASVNGENAGSWLELFKGVLADAQGISADSYANTTILFSREPKKEVAYGIIYSKQNNLDIGRHEKVERMIGLDCVIKGEEKSWSHDIPTNPCKDFDLNAINYVQFMNFLESFYGRLKNPAISEYIGVPSHFDKLSQSELNSFKNEISNYLQKRDEDELATPLFFLAVKVWTERLEKMI